MRVLQLNNFEHLGGGSDRVYQLTTKLLLDHGHEVATVSCGDTPFDARKQTVLLPRNGYIQRNPLATLRNIREFIRRPQAEAAVDALVAHFRPDVAHLHIVYGQLSSAIVSRLHAAGVPTVMTVHEYRMLCPVSTLFTPRLGVCERCAGGRYSQAVVHRCNRGSVTASALSAMECFSRDLKHDHVEKIDHFFMVSRFCLDKHAQYLPAIREKSSVLYNFVDTADSAGLPDTQRSLLYCGRLSQEKGLELLCQAMARRSGVQLLVAGEGALAPALRSRYSGYSNIRFLGKLDSQALKEHIRRAWFTVVPSEWYENNPMAVLESLAEGTPVLGARIGGIPEIVIDGHTGVLFEPSDVAALDHALDTAFAMSSEQRAALALQGMQLVSERHSARHYLQQLMAGYERVRTARSCREGG